VQDFEKAKTTTGRRKNCIACNKAAQRENLLKSYYNRRQKRIEGLGGKTPQELRRDRLLAYYEQNPLRRCYKCGVKKPLTAFVKDKNTLSGRGYICRKCSNKKKAEAARRRRAQAPPKAKKTKMTDAERRRKKQEYKQKYRKDPVRRMNRNMSEQIRKHMRDMRTGKPPGGWKSIVGYTLDELKEHLEALFAPGMSWSNYGEWHIDHIRPKASFSFASVEDPEFLACWSLDNLQPLWAEDNIRKGADIPNSAY
jgi:hypothetical protein